MDYSSQPALMWLLTAIHHLPTQLKHQVQQPMAIEPQSCLQMAHQC